MYWIIGILAGAAAVILTASYLAFKKIFIRRKRSKEYLYKGLDGELMGVNKLRRRLIEDMTKIPCEPLEILSKDEKKLRARLYRGKKDAPISILFHGYKSMPFRDFCGAFQTLLNLGHNLIVVDQRSHGDSDGRYITFGIKERFDVLSWCNYATELFGEDSKILLYGMSMGAASVIMAAELNLGKNVVGIIADSPFDSPKSIITKVLGDMNLSPTLTYPLIRLGAVIFGRFDPNSASARAAAKKAEIPILILHGEEDELVPPYMSERIAESSRTATLVKFKKATHCKAFLYDGDGYAVCLKNFLNKTVG
ncbi:MAG: alpha/beta hydrolase [Ruminococcaceae bacterium]|nr:alpha/beta hydrolase [Oscillospiraceae bacterium]